MPPHPVSKDQQTTQTDGYVQTEDPLHRAFQLPPEWRLGPQHPHAPSSVVCSLCRRRFLRLRFGNGVVGSLGGDLIVLLSPSSVCLVMRNPASDGRGCQGPYDGGPASL